MNRPVCHLDAEGTQKWLTAGQAEDLIEELQAELAALTATCITTEQHNNIVAQKDAELAAAKRIIRRLRGGMVD